MYEAFDILKLRVLMCFLSNEPQKCTATALGNVLHEEPYVISRILINLEKSGLINRSDKKSPFLTSQGRVEAERYYERKELAKNHLIYEGVDEVHALEDAYIWALYCSDELMEVIKSKDEQFRVKHEFIGEKTFTGEDFCSKFKDGSYSLPFIIYRERVKERTNLSMANYGFEHPCILTVKNGKGFIQLKRLLMSRRSVQSGEILKGKVSRLEYLNFGNFIPAEFDGDTIRFPVDAMNFINMGSGIGQVLHGSICLKMQCSFGVIHMPESKAFFTLLI